MGCCLHATIFITKVNRISDWYPFKAICYKCICCIFTTAFSFWSQY